ncbi:MAG: F0F1 ATP synthase subunit gamma [Chloroflexi bacterium]|nr:F0F1 ATP synthase subunit gamma [Chloroflexota bacterium]
MPLPVTRVPDFALVRALAEQLSGLLVEGRCDAIYIVFSPYQAGAIAAPISRRWLPFEASTLIPQAPAWPPPILETEPTHLFQQALREVMFAQLYQYVLESAAAEKSARFHAMDAASTNIARLVEEWTLLYHTARQHGITMEMLDLISSSGLLRHRPGRAAKPPQRER